MAGWKLRKDKTPAETLEAEAAEGQAPSAEALPTEALSTEVPQNEYLQSEVPNMEFEADAPARTYALGEPEDLSEPVSLDSLHHSSFDSEPEVHFTDLDFDSDPEDVSADSHAALSSNYSEQSDGPLTLVDYTEAAPTPQEFVMHGAQIFEMPPPTEMPLPTVEAPASVIEAAPPVIEALPPIAEAALPAETASQAKEAAEESFPERLRTGRFDRSELAPAPAFGFGIPTVSPFVLDTPLTPAAPVAPQLVVRVGRLSAPFALVKDVTTIGRPDSSLHFYPDVEIELDDAVSRRHAEVVKRDGSYYLVDTGSTNGTQLNGESLPPHQERLLAYGDRIRIGDRTEITFE